ncbi:MAG TPA: hypothetical protein PLY80_13740 [Pseudomonadota bacterium]|nr:hypothetical protein [Pseudomonadota bacterium]
MNRRTFLDAASRAALIASWPAWLQKAFADESKAQTDDDGLTVVSEGFRRAQRAGKPLLVLVIPKNSSDRYARGKIFGEYLNHATKTQHAPLQLCEVICATVQQLGQIVPSAGASDSLMILVETDKLPAEVRRINGKLPEGRSSFEISDREIEAEIPATGKEKPEQSWDRRDRARQQIESREVKKRIDKFAALLAEAVLPSPDVLGKRVVQQKAHAPAPLVAAVQEKLQADRDATLSAEELELCAAQIAQYAQSLPSPRKDKLQEQLGSAAENKLLRARVPGSKWARSSGCGMRIEGEDQRRMVACGMGHVPAMSSRFLFFFTK